MTERRRPPRKRTAAASVASARLLHFIGSGGALCLYSDEYDRVVNGQVVDSDEASQGFQSVGAIRCVKT
jgi:hypothetical protein